MKVLCIKSTNMCHSTMIEWQAQFQVLGHEFKFWEAGTKSAYDIFDEEKPDVFIGNIFDITRGIANCLLENKKVVSLMYSPPFKYVQEEQVYHMEQLKPNYIFGFVPYSSNVLAEWVNKGFDDKQILKVPHAVSQFVLRKPPLTQKEIASHMDMTDVVYVGDYHPSLNELVFPLLDGMKRVKVYGNGWPVPECLGSLEKSDIYKVFSQTKVVLDVLPMPEETSETSFNAKFCGSDYLSNSLLPGDINTFWNKETLLLKVAEALGRRFTTNYTPPAKPTDTYKDRINGLLETLDGKGVQV